jgi:hypothetical protein
VKPYKSGDLEGALTKKGFLFERGSGDKIYYLHHEGKKTSVFTKLSHGRGEELGFRLLKMIRDQLRLDTQGQLADFIDCPMSAHAYMEILKAKGVVRDAPPSAPPRRP